MQLLRYRMHLELMQDYIITQIVHQHQDGCVSDNSALAEMLGNLALTGGKVVFESHVYNPEDLRVDGDMPSGICTILYVRIYYNNERSIMIGTMVQTEDGNFFTKYVVSPTLLINKNITSYWSNWVSLMGM